MQNESPEMIKFVIAQVDILINVRDGKTINNIKSCNRTIIKDCAPFFLYIRRRGKSTSSMSLTIITTEKIESFYFIFFNGSNTLKFEPKYNV